MLVCAAVLTGRVRSHLELGEEPLLRAMGNANALLIGESTHGTYEFYHMRAEITKAFIKQSRLDFVAIEGDWFATRLLNE